MPGFRWDREKRLTLHLIVTQHKDTNVRASLFNKVFQDDFDACNKPQGHPWSTLGTQYGERKTKEYWQGVCSTPVSERDRARQEACQRKIDLAWAELNGHQTSESVASTSDEDENKEDEAVSASEVEAINGDERPTESSAIAEPSSPLRPTSASRFIVPSPSPAASVQRSMQAESPPTVRTPLSTSARLATATSSSPTPRAAIPLAMPQIEPQTLPAVQPAGTDQIGIDQARQSYQPEPVTQTQAYINPLPPFLFRCWSASSQGVNSASGFTSAKSAASLFRPPPPPMPENLDWDDIYNHISNKAVPGPFISASSSIVSILQSALNSTANVHISIILTEKLDKTGVYYARPFSEAIQKSGGLDEPGSIVVESSDWLIWSSIPERAVLSTIPISHIRASCEHSPEVLRTLLSILGEAVAPDDASNLLTLDVHTTHSLGQILQMFIDHTASISEFSQLISDMVHDCIQISTIPPPTHEEWYALAEVFADTFIKVAEQPISRAHSIGLKIGFIEGVRYACRANAGIPDISKVQELDNRSADEYVRQYVESEKWIRNSLGNTQTDGSQHRATNIDSQDSADFVGFR